MIRTFKLAAFAALLLEFGLGDLASNATAQGVVRDVDIENSYNFPVLIKRMGMEDGDQAQQEVPAGATTTIAGVPFQGDQVLTAWTIDGTNRCLGAVPITVEEASRNSIGMVLSKSGIVARMNPNGASVVPFGKVGLKKVPDGGAGMTGRNVRPPQNPGVAGEEYASNLGIHYTQLRYDNGTFGARISRAPAAGTPAAEQGFEVGDIIISLDGQTFRTPQEVLNHRKQTTVDLINVRTGARQSATINLP